MNKKITKTEVDELLTSVVMLINRDQKKLAIGILLHVQDSEIVS